MATTGKWSGRADVERLCAEQGLELEVSTERAHQGRSTSCHVHVYAPEGMVFAELETHNACLWDGERHDWRATMAELIKVLGQGTSPCPFGNNCEICHQEEA